MIELRDYQRQSADKLLTSLRTHGAALDASGTGTGKTPKAVIIAKELGLPVGVICPLHVIPVWRRWLTEGGVAPMFILNYEKLRTGNLCYADCVMTPTTARIAKDGKLEWEMEERFRWNLEPKHLLIFDEVHYAKGITSKNGFLLSGARPHSTLMLSATPFENPLDMRHTGYLLGLHTGKDKDFYQFAVNYGARKRHPKAADLVFFKNDVALARLHKRIFPEKGDKITIAELGDRFPRNEIIAESYEIDGTRTLTAELEKSLADLKARSESDDPENPMTLRLRERQQVELLKVPFIVEKAKQLQADGRSVVIFLNYRETCARVAEMLGAGVINGDVPPEEREKIRLDFQANMNHWLVCQIQIGSGFDLHDLNNRPRASIISPTDSLKDFLQAIGRINRLEARSGALQYVVGATGTVDEKVCANINRKRNNLELLTESDLSLG